MRQKHDKRPSVNKGALQPSGCMGIERRQRMTLKRIMRIALVSALWMLPTALWAQSTGSIAGLVTDASGAVVPGVTVEASSPALIERARSVVTDAAGRYEIVALPTGTYGVTFSLT